MQSTSGTNRVGQGVSSHSGDLFLAKLQGAVGHVFTPSPLLFMFFCTGSERLLLCHRGLARVDATVWSRCRADAAATGRLTEVHRSHALALFSLLTCPG
ncbi:hypothetical protein GN956_G6579 [Arapaima gigas]